MLLVCVYKYLTSMLEIEWKFFVFVEILEKGDSICVVKKPLQFSNFSVNISLIKHQCSAIHN